MNATIAPPRHRPGDQVLFRNGVSLILGTVSHVTAIPCTNQGEAIGASYPEVAAAITQAVWIWGYAIDGYGSGYLERQLTPVPDRLRTINWDPRGTGIDTEVWPVTLLDSVQPGTEHNA